MDQRSGERHRNTANAKSRDSLTGVLNKNTAEEQISSRLREKQGGTLFLCGVDGIKRINEQYGHLAGDECLKQAARILSFMIQPKDILGRRSGDEFVVFMPDCQDAQRAEAYAQRINNRFSTSRDRENKKVPYSMTVVWALHDGCIPGALFERADAEMRRRRAEQELSGGRERKERNHYTRDIRQVRKELLEQIKRPGAYCQDYETFKGIYRFLARGIIRSGQKACVILLTMVNEEGGTPLLQEKDMLMEQLGETIGDTLRIGDVYTRYTSSQYLLLVINAEKCQADLIAQRIRERFLARRHSNDVLIHRCYELEPAQIGEMAGDGGDGSGTGTTAGEAAGKW